MKTNFVLKTAQNSLKNLQTILAVSCWQRLYFIFLQTCLNGRQKLTFLSRNFNSGFCPINRPNRRVRDIIETELNLTFQKNFEKQYKKTLFDNQQSKMLQKYSKLRLKYKLMQTMNYYIFSKIGFNKVICEIHSR
jgi:hypothetical protein